MCCMFQRAVSPKKPIFVFRFKLICLLYTSKVLKEGARAREYENALQWLVDARLVHKIYRSSAPGLLIAAYDDLSAFKIYLVDVGLLRRLAQLAPTAFGEGNRLFTEFKGALTENFVLQTLITQFEVMPRYWLSLIHIFRSFLNPMGSNSK